MTTADRRPGNVIEVFPGKHALSKALAKAHPGDTLNVHAGTYKDSLVVTTSGIDITAAGDGPVTVNGRCVTLSTIAVRADGATIEGLTVIGGTFYEIDYQHVGNGDVVADTVTDTCGTAEYGVNLYDTQAVNVAQVVASGFSDSGLRGEHHTARHAKLFVINNESTGNEVGIIVEFSSMMHIVLDGNDVSDNEVGGVALQTSDGVIVRDTIANDDGTYGIQADAGSDKNLIKNNTALGNQFDLANMGTKNCFKHNTYQTHEGTIGC